MGKSGRLAVEQCLHQLKEDHEVDFTIANIENSVAGFGFNKKIYNQFLDMQIDALRVNVYATNGYPHVRINELRVYDSMNGDDSFPKRA